MLVSTDSPGKNPVLPISPIQGSKKIKYAIFLSVLLPIHALAACTANTKDGRDYFMVTVRGFTPPPFSPGDIPIGGIIYQAEGSGLTFTNASDPWGPKSTCSTSTYTYITGVGVPDASKVYPTSVPNVGLRVVSPTGQVAPFVEQGTNDLVKPWNIYYAPTIQLIKTGNVTESGVLSGAYAHYRANNGSGQVLVEYRFAKPVLVTPKVPSCTVRTPRIQVPMGETMLRPFSPASARQRRPDRSGSTYPARVAIRERLPRCMSR
ncbi:MULTISPECIES: hypothetical protein [Burkholderia]|nr:MULTISPECIES: hypothetical protein [Burkholderia]